MTSKTKGAKRRIDKMQKTSRERLAEKTKSATEKLKNVGKNLHDRIEMSTNNLSLGRQRKRSLNIQKLDSSVAESHGDRSQTAPPNDEVFQTISFNSPLNSKTNNCMTINSANGAESSYEIPKSLRSISSEGDVSATPVAAIASSVDEADLPQHPPSYDEIMKEDLAAARMRMTQPKPAARSRNLVDSGKTIAFAANVSTRERSVSLSDNDEEGLNERPQPSFPPPILSEGLYGKIKAKNAAATSGEQCKEDEDAATTTTICAPARTKRRKDYEQADIRAKHVDSVDSTSATIDSTEFRSTGEGRFPKIFSRDLSSDFSEKLNLEEKQVPAPSRSDSWSYYDLNDDRSEGSSTPEPIYANDGASRLGDIDESEPVYGVLYKIDAAQKALLKPQSASSKKSKSPDRSLMGAAGCSTDILKEFDPLDTNRLNKMFSNKSNEFILQEMETLLGEETYGTTADENHFEYHSTEPSDEEDSETPTPPQRLDSLPDIPAEVIKRDKKSSGGKSKNETDDERKTLIIHQNTSLRSDSLENIVDETYIEKYLAKTDDKPTEQGKIDLTRPAPSKSRWFLGNTDAASAKSVAETNAHDKIINKIDDKNMPKGDKCPPPYADVLADLEMMAAGTSTKSASAAATTDKRPISSTKASMKSMFSNVISKMEGIKRKASFKAATGLGKVPEVHTIIEMVPRPCLTTRLTLHEGHLIRLPTGVVEDILKEIHSRKAYIRDKKFQAFCDKDMKTPKENIPLENITTIQCVSNHKFTNHAVDMYCFEITTAVAKNGNNNLSNPNMLLTSNNSGNTKIQRTCHLYAVAKESERFIWMQKLLDSLTDVFPAGYSCKFYRAGWCYLKV